MPSSSSADAAKRSVSQSDWLPMTIATGRFPAGILWHPPGARKQRIIGVEGGLASDASASVPIPKFVSPRGTLSYELRNYRDTSNQCSECPFEPKVRKRPCGTVCANFGFGALAGNGVNCMNRGRVRPARRKSSGEKRIRARSAPAEHKRATAAKSKSSAKSRALPMRLAVELDALKEELARARARVAELEFARRRGSADRPPQPARL